MINDKCQGFSLIEVLVAVSLMAFLAVYLSVKTDEMANEDKFYKTCYMMEEIKEAIIGREGLYCNGVRQFTGYVSDTGNLPDLFYTDKDGLKKVTQSGSGRTQAIEGDDGLAEALKNGLRPRPTALWTKPEGMPKWKFHEASQLWAGWRGPYIDHPPGGALKDAWGNKFLFVIGEVIGVDEDEDNIPDKTYRCKKTYKATRDQQRRPGGADDYWEIINEVSGMNFRVWEDLGTAKDPDGNKVENIAESLQTKQEIFYGDSCLTIISLGKDAKPGGEGLDKDISIVVEPAEFMGEVAGNAGDREEGNLLVDRVCLYFPDYTEDGGKIKELCIPDSAPVMENNSQVLFFQPDSGICYTGINFRFGQGKSFSMDCLKWECEGTDDTDNCECSEHEEGDCIESECTNPSLSPTTPVGCECTKCFLDMGTPPGCCIACETALCTEFPDDWDWKCECQEYSVGPCIKWECEDPLSDEVCECIERGELEEDYTNTNNRQNIPIGIRTVTADSICYTISVCPGGNWIGTVRGSEH